MRDKPLLFMLALLWCSISLRASAELIIEDEVPEVPKIDPSAKLPDGAVARFLPPHAAPTAVAFSPDGKLVAVASADKTVQIFHASSSKLLGTLEGHEGRVLDVAFSPDGKYVASGGDDATARLWDLQTMKQTRKLEGHGAMVKGLCFSPDAGWLVTAGADQNLKIWDVASGELRYTLSGHDAHVDRVTWSRDGRTILSEAADSTARLWDGALGQEIRVLPERDGEVASVAISPDGRLGITSRGDMTWHVFEIPTGEDVLVLRGQSANGCCAAFSPDGRSVYTGALDGSLRQWDLTSGMLLRRLQASGPRMAALAVDPQGKRLVSASADCNVLVWDLTVPPTLGAMEITPPDGPLDAYLAKAWELMASSDYDARTMALWRFLKAGDAGAKALIERLPLARSLDSKQLHELIVKLDDPSYGVREASMQEIRDLGAGVLPYLQDALENPSPEIRMRVNDLLHTAAATFSVREMLAVEALGWMKAPLAREHLEKLVKGSRDQPVTQQAQAVLGRK